jgi:uncharacterized protein (TIGR02271 family)
MSFRALGIAPGARCKEGHERTIGPQSNIGEQVQRDTLAVVSASQLACSKIHAVLATKEKFLCLQTPIPTPVVPQLSPYFDSPMSAETAMSELRRVGFRADQIGCSCDDTYAATGTMDDGRSFWDKVSGFFAGEDRSDRSSQQGYELRVPDKYYDRLGSGGAFVAVHDANRQAEAEEVLRRAGGQVETDFSTFEQVAPESRRVEGEHRIALLSEWLRVYKEQVSRGEVRLRKEVQSEQKTIDVPVTREELVIERVPTTERGAAGHEIGEDEIRVPLSEERVRVEKEPIVREEVRVGKRPVERVENVSDEVRHEELRVEDETKVKDPKKRKSA